jgi:hypothetical protein
MGALVLMSSTLKNADCQPLVYASVYLFAMLRQSDHMSRDSGSCGTGDVRQLAAVTSGTSCAVVQPSGYVPSGAAIVAAGGKAYPSGFFRDSAGTHRWR